jgi:hypothetical protein
MIKLILSVLFFSATFHYAYVEFINPVFEYAYYLYNNPPIESILLTYLFLILPLVLYKNKPTAAYYGVAFIYIMCYVPGQLMMMFMWKHTFFDLIVTQIALLLSMGILFYISTKVLSIAINHEANLLPNQKFNTIVVILTIISTTLVILTYYKYMRIVSFADVYDLRFETNAIKTSVIMDYLLLWLTYVFIPYFFAIGIVKKRKFYIAIGIILSIIIYASSGAKVALLMGVMIYAINFAFKQKGDFLKNLLLYSGIFNLFLIIFIPDHLPWLYAKSMIFIRAFGTPGWTLVTYHDFFTQHGYTYYGHINIVNFLFGNYPYGNFSLGQMIGMEYSGSSDANFNANFWASDGFAGAGTIGLLIATLLLSIFLFILNNIARFYSPHFLSLFLVGYWQALLNVPLMTSLLSGGGLLILLLLQSKNKINIRL